MFTLHSRTHFAHNCAHNFLGDPEGPRSQPAGVVVLDIAGGRVAGITRFLEPALVKVFLPTWEPAS
jgi:hypothetical protein